MTSYMAYLAENNRERKDQRIIELEKENAELKRKLKELVFDVYFKPENQHPFNDVIWHSSCCTAFENVCHLLEIDCTHGDFDRMGEDLKQALAELRGEQ